MDPSLNDFDEEVRAADEVTTERLIEDNRSLYDREIEEAVYLSMQEIRNNEIANYKFEEEVIKKYHSETLERREKFNDLLHNMNKLFKFDKDIKEVYDIIEPIIDAYCLDYIKHYELDQETHDKIFKVLRTIRISNNTFNTLREIIVISS